MPSPKDPIKRELWRLNMSKSCKGKNAWNKGRKMSDSFKLKMAELSKKFWTDPNNVEKIKLRNKKIADSKLGDKNPMKRPGVVAKRSLKMIGKLVGDKNPSRSLIVQRKIKEKLLGHQVSIATRKKISQSLAGKLIGELNPFYGRRHTAENKEKSRARAINMITSGLLSNRRTQIEVKIREALSRTNLKFNEQVPLEKITVVDFYLPDFNTVIYCDGDYWHRGEWAKKHNVAIKDNLQTKILESRGYKVFRFSEAEINNSAEECINFVKSNIL